MGNTRHSYKVIRNRSRNKKSVKKNFKTVTKKNKRKIRSRNKIRIMKGGMEDGNEDTMEIEIRTEEETKRGPVNSNSTVIQSIIDNIVLM